MTIVETSYVKLDNSDAYDVRDLNEFGRSWTFADCGLTTTSEVRTLFQPIANRFAGSAVRAMIAHSERVKKGRSLASEIEEIEDDDLPPSDVS